MELNELVADLEGFLAETAGPDGANVVNIFGQPAKAEAPKEAEVVDNSESIAREIIGFALGTVDEDVSSDVLAQRIFQATRVVTEDVGDPDAIFEKAAAFFEGVAAEARLIQEQVAEVTAEPEETESEED